MVSYEVAWASALQPAPAMFIDDAHILRASSSTVCACISKRPAIARIECGSVIKRVGMSPVSFVCCVYLEPSVLEGHIGCHRCGGCHIADRLRPSGQLVASNG